MFYQFIKHDFGPDCRRHQAKSCFIKLLNKVVKVAKVVKIVKVVFYNLPRTGNKFERTIEKCFRICVENVLLSKKVSPFSWELSPWRRHHRSCGLRGLQRERESKAQFVPEDGQRSITSPLQSGFSEGKTSFSTTKNLFIWWASTLESISNQT